MSCYNNNNNNNKCANSNTNNKTTLNVANSIKFSNCISTTKSDSLDGNHVQGNSSTSGYNSKASNSYTKSSDSSLSFNSLTQRFSKFSFLSGSEKKSSSSTTTNTLDASNTTSTSRSHRKTINLLKSNNHNSNFHHPHNSSTIANTTAFDLSGTLENSKSNKMSHTFGSIDDSPL